MAGKRKRGNRLYALCLLLYGGLIVAAAVLALQKVWVYAEEYENSRPAHAIDKYVAELNRELWSDGIARAVEAMPHETQSDEEIKAYVQDRLKGGISAVRKGGSGSGSIAYSLRCDGAEIGSVTIVEDSSYRGRIDVSKKPWSILPWSIRPWKLGSESFDFSNLYSAVEITVPSSYEVWLNGVKLGAQYIVEEHIPYDVYADYYKYWDYLPTKVKYRFDHVIGELEPVVKDENGNVVVIDESKGDRQFITPITGEELDRFDRFVDGFTEKYLVYTSGVKDNGLHLAELKPYLLPGADLERRMIDALDGLSWAHTVSVNVESIQFNSLLELTDGFYECDISATARTFTYGKGEETMTSNMKVLVYDDGEKLLAESLELY